MYTEILRIYIVHVPLQLSPLASWQMIPKRYVQSSVLERVLILKFRFGQFLDHDLDLAPSTPSDIVFSSDGFVSCDDICSNDAPCFPIPVPEDDPRIHRACIPFTRSSAVCGTGASSLLVGPAAVLRQQLNAITAYLDASQVPSAISSSTHHAITSSMDGMYSNNT